MAEINIREEITKYQADTRDRAAKIESDKAIFVRDYQNLERKLEKELTDPGLTFDQRQIRQNRLMNLKLGWQRNGIGDINVVIGMRENCLSLLKEFNGLPEAEQAAFFGETRKHVAEFDAIISAAKSKGLV